MLGAGTHGTNTGSNRQFPGIAVAAAEQCVGVVIADDALERGVPSEIASEHHGDVAEVGYGDGPMGDFAGRDGFLARAN